MQKAKKFKELVLLKVKIPRYLKNCLKCEFFSIKSGLRESNTLLLIKLRRKVKKMQCWISVD